MTPVGVGLAGSGGFDVGVENLNPNRIAASSTSMSGVPTAASLATNGALASGMGMGHSLHGQGQVQPMRRFSGSILPPQQQQQALPQQQYQFQPALEVQVCASFHCFYDFHCLFVFLFFFFSDTTAPWRWSRRWRGELVRVWKPILQDLSPSWKQQWFPACSSLLSQLPSMTRNLFLHRTAEPRDGPPAWLPERLFPGFRWKDDPIWSEQVQFLLGWGGKHLRRCFCRGRWQRRWWRRLSPLSLHPGKSPRFLPAAGVSHPAAPAPGCP